jgi:predicted nucleotidyltransferase
VNELSLPQLAALRTLRLAYAEEPIVLIGAAALAFHLPMNWRTTSDIDLVLAVSASELETVLSRLPGWRHDLKQEQRWNAPNNVRIDLVPAPPEALNQRQLVWPRTKDEMSLGGMRLALTTPRREIAPGVRIAIAPVAVITLLKMAAYLERPGAREKDLQDLGHILNGYPTAEDERFYSDDIFSNGLDDRQARAFILGRELREMVDDDDREIVNRFMSTMSTKSALNRLEANSPWRHHDDREEQVRVRLDAFRLGFTL